MDDSHAHADAPAAALPASASASDPAAAPITPLSSSSSSFHTVVDADGLSLTLPSSVSSRTGLLIASHVHAYSLQVLQYGRCWDVILRALTLTQECALAHVLAADFWIAKNDIPNALRSLRAAESLLPAQQAHLTPRELCYVRGYGAMLSNQLRESLFHFQRALDHCPSDLFAVKKVQLLAFVLGGRPDMLAVVLRPDVAQACEGKRFFHALQAFALEENERFDEAATAVDKALSIDPSDPWAIHVHAHLLYARGAQEEGAPWMEQRTDHWSGCMSFLYSHCWFHMSLLRLDSDDLPSALGIFDHAVWPHHTAAEADQAAAPAGPVPSALKRISDAAAAVASEEEEKSFGVAPTPLSFQRHDRFYVEDQNGALNLLWRLEMRMVGAGAPGVVHDAATAIVQASTAAASGDPSSSQSQSSSPSPSPLPLSSPALSSRWRSIVDCLTLPPVQALSLFGLLQLHALCRVGRMEQGRQFRALLEAQVAQVADEQRRGALKAVLLPLAEAIVCYYGAGEDDAGGASGVHRAFTLVHRLLVEDAPHFSGSAATHTADTGVDTKQGPAPAAAAAAEATTTAATAATDTGTDMDVDSASAPAGSTAGSARCDPSAAEMSSIAAACAVSSFSPALAHASLPGHGARLACLAASGEQLEVVVEWYIELAAAAGKWDELLRVVEGKLAHRGTVQWYHRLNRLAEKHKQQEQQQQQHKVNSK